MDVEPKTQEHRHMNPYIQEAYRLRDIYGSEVFDRVGGAQEISSIDIVRQTRLNPQLGNPISLLEQWDGSVSLKQENNLSLHLDDLAILEEAYKIITANPQQDYHSECDQYKAQEKQFLLQGEVIQITFGRGGLAILKRLIDALHIQQTTPSIQHKV